MYDEGCPNENQSVDDATGYSKEEGETLEEESLSEGEEFISSRVRPLVTDQLRRTLFVRLVRGSRGRILPMI